MAAGEIIDFVRLRPPSWGRAITLRPADLHSALKGNEAVAELSGFWGEDGLSPSARLEHWAAALDVLAEELRASAEHLAEEG